MAKRNSTPVKRATQLWARAGYVRGLRVCVEMLENMDIDECSIAGVSVPFTRRGRPQDNAVHRNIDEILQRGDPHELEGFCAALTDIVASADENGDFYRMFTKLADEQLRAAVAHG
jgi:hypothetical protein